MRRWGGWKLKVALLVSMGLAAPALAGDSSDDTEPKSGLNIHWANWWQDSNHPAPKKKPADKPKPPPPAAEPKPVAPRPTSAVDRASAQREKEVQAFLRRVAVCDELHRIAQETRDPVLERKADELDKRAWAVYNRHTANLPGHNVDLTADERTLDRRLGTVDAGRDGPAGLDPATRNDRGQVAVGEGKP